MGWVLVAILSPIIVLVALLCSLGSGASTPKYREKNTALTRMGSRLFPSSIFDWMSAMISSSSAKLARVCSMHTRYSVPGSGSPDTIQALEEHWAKLQVHAQEQGEEQAPIGPEAGGLQLG